jgi:hypothetical protein
MMKTDDGSERGVYFSAEVAEHCCMSWFLVRESGRAQPRLFAEYHFEVETFRRGYEDAIVASRSDASRTELERWSALLYTSPGNSMSR